MNYYERHIGDYQKDTATLSLLEHGAYTQLLDTYYATEMPLPADMARLYRVCRAVTADEQAAVAFVVKQFFPLADDGLRHNGRADDEIAKAQARISVAQANGKKGGRPPKNPGDNPPGNPAGNPPDIPPGNRVGFGSVSSGDDSEAGGSSKPAEGASDRQSFGAETTESRRKNPDETQRGGQRQSSPTTTRHTPPSSPSERGSVPRASAADLAKIGRSMGVDCQAQQPQLLAMSEQGVTPELFTAACEHANSRTKTPGRTPINLVVSILNGWAEDARKVNVAGARTPTNGKQAARAARAEQAAAEFLGEPGNTIDMEA